MKKFLTHGLVLAAVLAPLAASAAGLVPCDGPGGANGGSGVCDFKAFMLLLNNLINYVILLAIPVAGALVAYAGFLFLTDQGSEANVKKARGILMNVVWGFIFILGAWVIVKFVITSLVKNDLGSGILETFFSQ